MSLVRLDTENKISTIYHLGETYNAQVKSYNASGDLADATGTPTVALINPEGTEVSSQNLTNTSTGIYTASYDIPEGAIVGSWKVKPSFVDAETSVEIETESFYVVDAIYTTPKQVASILRLMDMTTQARLELTNSTDPTLNEVERSIMTAMDFVDRDTNHAWRASKVTDEYYDVLVKYTHMFRRDVPLHLKHRKLRPFVSGTDKIEFWTGTEWKDLILTANGYTEGRDNDYWIDYDKGVIHFVAQRPLFSAQGVRVTYRYGDKSVPADIENATSKRAAIDIMETNDYVVNLPEGVNQYGVSSKVESWKKDVSQILGNYREIITV